MKSSRNCHQLHARSILPSTLLPAPQRSPCCLPIRIEVRNDGNRLRNRVSEGRPKGSKGTKRLRRSKKEEALMMITSITRTHARTHRTPASSPPAIAPPQSAANASVSILRRAVEGAAIPRLDSNVVSSRNPPRSTTTLSSNLDHSQRNGALLGCEKETSAERSKLLCWVRPRLGWSVWACECQCCLARRLVMKITDI